MSNPDCDLRVLVVGASLSTTSLNNRLAAFTAKLVADKGATTDLATIDQFDCPFYDRDLEVETGGVGAGVLQGVGDAGGEVRFVSAPMDHDVEITGPLACVLFMSTTNVDWPARNPYRCCCVPQPFSWLVSTIEQLSDPLTIQSWVTW